MKKKLIFYILVSGVGKRLILKHTISYRLVYMVIIDSPLCMNKKQDKEQIDYKFYPVDSNAVIKELGRDKLLELLTQMLLIRNFEIRAEGAYLQGYIGGFFHAYMGQEAVQVAAVEAFGALNWWTTTYRCHALALLLGMTPNEGMAELFGKETGNAKGRGGSMHLYADRLLGGFGIVGGHLPIALGAGLTLKCHKNREEISIVFLGDGAVAQGTFHESLNLASLWDLPCVFVIENNKWGMGTSVDRAISIKNMAKKFSECYGMQGYTLNGMEIFDCYQGFTDIKQEVLTTRRPCIVEVVTDRFRGHSISDPGLYRSKEALHNIMANGPIHRFQEKLFQQKMLTEEEFKELDKKQKEIVLASITFAEESPFPDLTSLEEGVYSD